jgi:4-hydroxy-tetrahydrodipicolinate synthase
MMRALIDTYKDGGAEEQQARLDKIRHTFEKYPLIPALKAFVARADSEWGRVRPPLEALSEDAREKLFADLKSIGIDSLS